MQLIAHCGPESVIEVATSKDCPASLEVTVRSPTSVMVERLTDGIHWHVRKEALRNGYNKRQTNSSRGYCCET